MRACLRSIALLSLAVAAALAVAAPATSSDGRVRAGVAAVDASWHVGASAGPVRHRRQLRRRARRRPDHPFLPPQRLLRHPVAPEARALVVEGPDGSRDRARQERPLHPPGPALPAHRAAARGRATPASRAQTSRWRVTHNHSSPYYSSTSWGVWAFQDVFDVRFFDYYAKRMAAAVEQAAADLKPVRVGASVSTFDKTHRHSFGPAIADDGTPAGYPHGDTDHDLTVVRFDDVSDPAQPKPLANLVNYSLHPEFLEGNDLISADYLAPLQRMIDRATGALTICTQNAVGTAEPERSTYHSIHERLEFSHTRLRAGRVRRAPDGRRDRRHVARHRAAARPSARTASCRSTTRSRSAMEDRWFPGPLSHPYPGVSNCRADKAFDGDPQVPVVGLPDCENGVGVLQSLASLVGLPRPPDPPSDPDRPGPLDRRLPVARHPAARELLGSLLHRARGGRQRPPPGIPARRHPVHGLLVRAVVRPERDIKTRTDRVRGQPLASATTGPRAARTTATAPARGPARTRTTRPRTCRRSPTQRFLRMRAR